MTCPTVRWARCPFDGRLHAVDDGDVELTSIRGYAEALCGHRVPGDDLAFADVPSGSLCVPCVIGFASDLPNPGRFGTAL
jgi:hypothetical protein